MRDSLIEIQIKTQCESHYASESSMKAIRAYEGYEGGERAYVWDLRERVSYVGD